MNAESIFDALELVDESFKKEALEFMEYKHMKKGSGKKKAVKLFLIAAVIVSLFTVTAYAVDSIINSAATAEKVARQEFKKMQELGLYSREITVIDEPADFTMESEAQEGGDYWYDRLFTHSWYVRWYTDEDNSYFINLKVDTTSGKIVDMAMEAEAGEDDVPIGEAEWQVPIDDEGNTEMMTMYYYDNFDDLIDPDITIDEYCSLLAEYWGFEGYSLGKTVEEDFYHLDVEAPSGDTLLTELSKMDEYYLTVYFEGDQEGVPMYVQLVNFPGRVCLLTGTNHAVG